VSASVTGPRYSEERAAPTLGRLAHGAGAGAVAYVMGTAGNLLLLPLYLHHWPVRLYGEWLALYSLVGYLNNLDFGLTAAAINGATMAYARQDWSEFKRIQGTAWAVSLGIAALATFGLALPAAILLPVGKWLSFTELPASDARLVIFCLATSLMVGIPTRQLLGAHIAAGEFASYQWRWNAYSFVSLAVTAVLLAFGASPSTVAVGLASVSLLNICCMAVLLRCRDKRLVPRLRDAHWPTARALASPTADFGLSMFASTLSIQGPIVLLSHLLGGAAVAVFTTTRTVANLINQTAGLLRYPLRPELAASAATKSLERLRRLFRAAMALDVIVCSAGLAGLWSGGIWFIEFWSRGRIHPPRAFLQLILIAVALDTFQLGLGRMGSAVNRFRGLAVGQFCAAAMSLLIAWPLVHSFGVSAVPLSSALIVASVCLPLALRNASQHAHLSTRFLALRIVVPALLAGALSTWVGSVVNAVVPSRPWLAGSLAAATGTVIASSIAGLTFLTRDDRRAYLVRIRVWLSALKSPAASKGRQPTDALGIRSASIQD
jgi:O-antigen/teichoic acid export membrane protein